MNKNTSQNSKQPISHTTKPRAMVKTQKPKVTMDEAGFFVPDAIRQTWGTAYPEVDIDRETAKAWAWCQNNPRKAPKSDCGRFLNGWMGRAKPTIKRDAMLDPDGEYEVSADDAAIQLQFERDLAAGRASCG